MNRTKLYQIALIGTIVIIIVLVIALFINYNQNQNNSFNAFKTQLDIIKEKNELRIGMLKSTTPYYIDHYSDENDPSGFDYELLRAFADYLGVQITIIEETNLTSLFDNLKQGKYDLIANGLFNLPERRTEFRASPPYYKASLQMVYRNGNVKPKNIDSLSGSLMIPVNSAQSIMLRNLTHDDNNHISWQETSKLSSEELVKEVALGNLDYTIADSLVVSIVQRIYPSLAIAFDITDKMPVSWYLSRTSDASLYDAVTDFFNQMSDDGTLARLDEKYLDYIGDFDFVDTRSFINAIESRLPKYQSMFEKHAQLHGIDWLMLAAISYQESHWNPKAKSSTGVRGMMMLTKTTAQSLGVINRLDPEESIRGGSTYLKQLLEKLPASINPDERIWFALAAYNMGFAHLIDARMLTKKQGDNPDSWSDVKKRLPMLSRKEFYSQTKYGYARGYQAYNFVENIRRYRVSLAGYLFEKKYQQEVEKQMQITLEEEQINTEIMAIEEPIDEKTESIAPPMTKKEAITEIHVDAQRAN